MTLSWNQGNGLCRTMCDGRPRWLDRPPDRARSESSGPGDALDDFEASTQVGGVLCGVLVVPPPTQILRREGWSAAFCSTRAPGATSTRRSRSRLVGSPLHEALTGLGEGVFGTFILTDRTGPGPVPPPLPVSGPPSIRAALGACGTSWTRSAPSGSSTASSLYAVPAST